MKQTAEIIFFPDAFMIKSNSEKHQISWEAISKIITYKLDLLSIDEICIDIYTNDKIYTVTEEFHNWEPFIKILEKKISFNKDWLKHVTLPAFERNEAVLFNKIGINL